MLGNALHKEDRVKSKKDWGPPIEEERRQSSTSEKRLVLQLNKAGQPIGKLAGIWLRWLGSIARIPYICLMDYV